MPSSLRSFANPVTILPAILDLVELEDQEAMGVTEVGVAVVMIKVSKDKLRLFHLSLVGASLCSAPTRFIGKNCLGCVGERVCF